MEYTVLFQKRKLKWSECELCCIKTVLGYLVLGKINLYHSNLKIILLQLKLAGDREEHLTALPSSTKLFFWGGGAAVGRGPFRPLNP